MAERTITKELTKRLGGRQEAIDEEARTATFVFSTASPDRMNDIVDQKTWQLDRYKQNPQFLWAHRSREMPIGKTIKLEIVKNKLIGTVKFATADEYEFAETCWKMVKSGFLNAVSVGFIPQKWESYSDGDTHGYKFYDCELLECSLVPIPANQDALLGTKDLSGGLVPVYRSLLDGYQDDDSPVFERGELEAVVRSFGSPEKKSEPDMKISDDIDGTVVYDVAGEMMGLMVNGSLKMTRTYQDKLRNRNSALIDQQVAATTAATTEKKTEPTVGPNFFLKRSAAKRLARNTLLGV